MSSSSMYLNRSLMWFLALDSKPVCCVARNHPVQHVSYDLLHHVRLRSAPERESSSCRFDESRTSYTRSMRCMLP